MLEDIVTIVDRKIRGGLPHDFLSTFKKEHRFVDAYSFVGDYCRKNAVDLPDRIIVNNAQTFYEGPFAAKGQNNEVSRTKINNVENSNSRTDNFSFKDYNAPHRQPEKVDNPSILISSQPSSQLHPQSEK